jgi:hypothetical protein
VGGGGGVSKGSDHRGARGSAALATRARAAAAPAAEALAPGERRPGPFARARERIVLELLEDELREVRSALAAAAACVAGVEAALGDGEPSRQRLPPVAPGGERGDRIEELAAAVASIRRRLARLAART